MYHVLYVFGEYLEQEQFSRKLLLHHLELFEGMVIQDVPDCEQPVLLLLTILVQSGSEMVQFVCFFASTSLKVAYILLTGFEVAERLLFLLFYCTSIHLLRE